MAMNALALIYFQMIDADLVEEPVDRAQRAHRFAEKPFADQHSSDRADQDRELQKEERPDGLAQVFIGQEERDAALQRPDRADVLAEGRLAHAHEVRHQDRHRQHEDREQNVFDVSERLPDPVFADGQLPEQVLQKAERTEKTADPPAHQRSDRQDEPHGVEAEVEVHGAAHCLQRSNRARRHGGRARIAVHARIAEFFEAPGVDPAFGEVVDMTIREAEGSDLDELSLDLVCYFHCFLSASAFSERHYPLCRLSLSQTRHSQLSPLRSG